MSQLITEPTEENKHMFVPAPIFDKCPFAAGVLVEFNKLVPKIKSIDVMSGLSIDTLWFTLHNKGVDKYGATIGINVNSLPRSRFVPSLIEGQLYCLQFDQLLEYGKHGSFNVKLNGTYNVKTNEMIIEPFTTTNTSGDATIVFYGYTLTGRYTVDI